MQTSIISPQFSAMALKENFPTVIAEFQQHLQQYFMLYGRQFLWRNPPYLPYHIVVSEIMLQQTQTHRVCEKFALFIERFPTFEDLSAASVSDVIIAWQGLGYNRRALALHAIAKKVTHEFQGLLPNSPEILQTFPGIGAATAASICAFAFNMPTVFIETNIRAVYIHTFFSNNETVTDKQLWPLISQTLDHNDPRRWYYALMDYGVYLKKAYPNPSRKSALYKKQSKFEGSKRQLRGMILRLLSSRAESTLNEIVVAIKTQSPETIMITIETLIAEGFIINNNGLYHLTK